MVPGVGLEPTRPFGLGILSPLCLPFHHPGKRNHCIIISEMRSLRPEWEFASRRDSRSRFARHRSSCNSLPIGRPTYRAQARYSRSLRPEWELHPPSSGFADRRVATSPSGPTAALYHISVGFDEVNVSTRCLFFSPISMLKSNVGIGWKRPCSITYSRKSLRARLAAAKA